MQQHGRYGLAILGLAVFALLLVPEVTQARTRTGTDLGARVAALEEQQATNAEDIAANAADLLAHMSSGDHDDRYVRDSGEDLRLIRGGLAPDATIVFGDGFTASNPETGVYVITFDEAFSDEPAAVATIFNDEEGGFTVVRVDDEVDQVTFNTYDASNAAADVDIDFVIVGPQ